jgi:hypothetical protein
MEALPFCCLGIHQVIVHRWSRRLSRKNASWNSNRDGIGGDVSEHYGIGSDRHVVADPDWAEYLGAGAYIHTIPQSRRSALTGMSESNCDPVANDAIVAKYRVPADDDSPEMIDPKTPSKRYL